MLLQARFADNERLELLHPIEDRLDTHPGALPVLVKRGNSILTEGCLRMWSFLSRRIHPPFMHPQIQRKSHKLRGDKHAYPSIYFNNRGHVVFSRVNIDEIWLRLPDFKVHVRGGGSATWGSAIYRNVVEAKVEAACTTPVSEILSRVVNAPVERYSFRLLVGDTIRLLDRYVTSS